MHTNSAIIYRHMYVITEIQECYLFFLNTVRVLRTAGLVEEFTLIFQFIPVITIYLTGMQQTA